MLKGVFKIMLKYSYMTDSIDPWSDFGYYGPFQTDVEDFRNFMRHLPDGVVFVFVRLENGHCYSWTTVKGWIEITQFVFEEE